MDNFPSKFVAKAKTTLDVILGNFLAYLNKNVKKLRRFCLLFIHTTTTLPINNICCEMDKNATTQSDLIFN